MRASMPHNERRGETRRVSHVHARLRTTDARPVSPVDALIEDRGPRGVRLTSKSPLLEDAVVVLHLSGELRPLHARVVWARRVESRSDPSWKAGCRLMGAPEGPTSHAGNLVHEPDAVAVRVLVAAGMIGLAVLFVYAIVSFATLVGEAAAIGP